MEEGNIVALSPDDFTQSVVYGTIVYANKDNITVEFSPYVAIYTVIEWTKQRKRISMIHFPGLLISVLPMLDNIQNLYKQQKGVFRSFIIQLRIQVENKLYGYTCQCATTTKKEISLFSTE